jgi:hypothetical protein
MHSRSVFGPTSARLPRLRSKDDPHQTLADFLPPGTKKWRTFHTGTDVGPYINEGLNYLRRQFGRGTLEIPPGTWRVATQLDPVLCPGNFIVGQGSQASKIVYDRGSGSMWRHSGDGGFSGGGLKGLGIFLDDGYPTSTAIAIASNGDAAAQMDQVSFDDLYISIRGNSWWNNVILVKATERTNPQGSRVAHWNNIQVFGARAIGISLQNVVQHTFTNLGIYTPKTLNISCTTNGTTTLTGTGFLNLDVGMVITGPNIAANTVIASITNTNVLVMNLAATGSGTQSLQFQAPNGGSLFIGGGGSANTNSTQVSVYGLVTTTPLSLTNCRNVIVQGLINGLITAATATHCNLLGENAGSVVGAGGTGFVNNMS